MSPSESPEAAMNEALTPPHNQRINLEVLDDFTTLVGSVVEIWNGHVHVRNGRVEFATLDGSIMWLSLDGPHLRQMIHREDAYNIWIHTDAAWPDPPRCPAAVEGNNDAVAHQHFYA